MKFTITFLALFLTFTSYGGSPKREDALAKQYWNTLGESTKTAFLAGFRHGVGPEFHVNQRETLLLHQEDISKLIPLIDSFYKAPENKDVYLRFAIEICLMQMMDKPKLQIDAATKTARYATSVHD